jgi:hypothetical protein
MQQIHVRALCAALAIYVFGGCSQDPPTASNPSPTAVSLTNVHFADVDSLEDPAASAGLLGDMSDLGPLYLQPDNWWNADVTNAPVDPGSFAMITAVQGYESTGGRLHPDFGSIYGMPYAVVAAGTPLVPVTFSNSAESDRGVPGGPVGYPIPAEAKTNLRYFEEQGASASNNHILLIDKDRRYAFELFKAQFNGTSWTATSGAIFNLNNNLRRPEGWTSADAAGLCVTAGLLRYDEVYGMQPIRHALRCFDSPGQRLRVPGVAPGCQRPVGYCAGHTFSPEAIRRHLGLFDADTKDFPGDEDVRADRRGPRRQHVRPGHDGFAVEQQRVEPGVPRAQGERFRNHPARLEERRQYAAAAPPPPPGGDVDTGLLADLSSLGTLYDRADNWWNLDVSSAPLDPNSSAILSTVKSYDHHYVHPDFGGAGGDSPTRSSINRRRCAGDIRQHE